MDPVRTPPNVLVRQSNPAASTAGATRISAQGLKRGAGVLVIAAQAFCISIAAGADVACASLSPGTNQPNDYRARNSDAFLQWSIADNMQNHIGPALERMRSGEYSRAVMADLDFTLVRWPNHLGALQALVQYALRGGNIYEFSPPQCYFANAREFAPDDVDVIQAEAYFHWKKGDKTRARATYQEALAIAPDSPDVHYNLGLLLAEAREFDDAATHARIAYAAGYPLPGLRRILEKSGHWQDPSGDPNASKN